MALRSACWSITINNPTEEELKFERVKANAWRIEGQLERGKEGTVHYQGMLVTPQKPAFSTVKTVLPRAHIEKARQKELLQKYVHKSDTQLAKVEEVGHSIPTIFEYQDTVAQTPDILERINNLRNEYEKNGLFKEVEDCALVVVDAIVSKHIEQGMRGIEYIAINPMWRSSWKKFWRSIIKRHHGRYEEIRASEERSSDTFEDIEEGVNHEAEDTSKEDGS